MAPLLAASPRGVAAAMRSCGSASTSAPVQPSCRPAALGRARCVRVQAADAWCRDKVNTVRTDVSSQGATYKLTFLGAGGETREIIARDNQYILDAAEAGGLDLPATCRGGICGACVARVAKGTIDPSDIADLEFTVSADEQAQGMALLCMTRATSDLSIETQSDWGYSLGVGEWKGATGKFTSRPDPLVGTAGWSQVK
ncbi:Ferredoxin-1 [Tetrabaena socialis]|uniref:Ferredoxin-1 n=1 Tax=Tetrabaena socialis TaxID=47790 RepID=A0A2J8AG67_9CHLO|nr:Ferredoxin-1 [Tetrabaena socialis]|eukprot:PNH11507.1 Ferredoxin-1 [Tetrabaena socialis]